ncbi:hypothetical protein M2156_000986 [Streptomyces sp. SAI-149]|nr:hypothetical protein [Streptomyces sp. SAI-149]
MTPAVAVHELPVLARQHLRRTAQSAETEGAVASCDERVGVQEGLPGGPPAVELHGQHVPFGPVRQHPAQCRVDAVGPSRRLQDRQRPLQVVGFPQVVVVEERHVPRAGEPDAHIAHDARHGGVAGQRDREQPWIVREFGQPRAVVDDDDDLVAHRLGQRRGDRRPQRVGAPVGGDDGGDEGLGNGPDDRREAPCLGVLESTQPHRGGQQQHLVAQLEEDEPAEGALEELPGGAGDATHDPLPQPAGSGVTGVPSEKRLPRQTLPAPPGFQAVTAP